MVGVRERGRNGYLSVQEAISDVRPELATPQLCRRAAFVDREKSEKTYLIKGNGNQPNAGNSGSNRHYFIR